MVMCLQCSYLGASSPKFNRMGIQRAAGEFFEVGVLIRENYVNSRFADVRRDLTDIWTRFGVSFAMINGGECLGV